ncbi:hypothetical protein ACFPRL_22000 [Pseudoclavibacter helvolus]
MELLIVAAQPEGGEATGVALGAFAARAHPDGLDGDVTASCRCRGFLHDNAARCGGCFLCEHLLAVLCWFGGFGGFGRLTVA